MRWWVHELWQAGMVVELVSWIVWVLFSIVLHELAHGWAALWQGDDTPRRLDRMTINPLVHMQGMSLIAFAIIGIAWGVMPTDPSRYRWGRKGRVVVAGAGPAMNVGLALVTLTLLVLWLKVGPTSHPIYRNLAVFLWTGGKLNLLLALFNLMPVPPLDGASILSGLSYRAYHFFQQPQAMMFGFFLLMVIFVTPLGGIFWMLCELAGAVYVDLSGTLLGNPSLFDVV